jgi:hypothetical protein
MTPKSAVGVENRYGKIFEHIFKKNYRAKAELVPFVREDIERAAKALKIALPKNVGDVVYSFRYRTELPRSIKARAPKGMEWVIRPTGRGKYAFAVVDPEFANILPSPMLVETKVPDSTPGVIAMYRLSDEQALLAILRYNRLIDIFTGVACYSLQSHLRTSVAGLGQVETDEVYVGVDRRGAHFVFPVQAKGGRDSINIVQIEQDFAMCAEKFPAAQCRPIAAQFMDKDVIALFEFENTPVGVRVYAERHYRLVPSDEISEGDRRRYLEAPV